MKRHAHLANHQHIELAAQRLGDFESDRDPSSGEGGDKRLRRVVGGYRPTEDHPRLAAVGEPHELSRIGPRNFGARA